MNLETDLQAMFTPGFETNPYSVYAKARVHGDLVVVPEWNNAFAFSIDAVNALFKHPSASANRLGVMDEAWFGTKLLQPMMLFHDASSHMRLRSLVSQAFTPKAIAETRNVIADLTDELLEQHVKQGGDFLTNVAVPLPMLVIAKLLGLETVDRIAFRNWADALIVVLDGSALNSSNPQVLEQHISQMFTYFAESAETMKMTNAPGVLGAMARAEAGGQRLTREELLANAALLLAAGFETTTNLIAGAMLAFSDFPSQWQLLLEQPELLVNAAEECLRFVTPVQATSRQVQNALIEWQSQQIPIGTHISLMLGAANRDPKKFENPDDFDIARENASQHVAFASGAHYCLGAPLARLEMQVFLERLALKYPNFAVPHQTLEYRPNFSIRGLMGLEVQLTQSGRLH
jgi:cytochrome P450